MGRHWQTLADIGRDWRGRHWYQQHWQTGSWADWGRWADSQTLADTDRHWQTLADIGDIGRHWQTLVLAALADWQLGRLTIIGHTLADIGRD